MVPCHEMASMQHVISLQCSCHALHELTFTVREPERRELGELV